MDDTTAAEPAPDLVQAPPAPEPGPVELPPTSAEQPAHSDAMDTAAAAKPASGTAEEPRDVADNLQPVGADFAAYNADQDDHTAASQSELVLLPNHTPPYKGVGSVVSMDDDAVWGVRGLSRGWSPGGFSIWHLDLPEHTTSDALAADLLSCAADYIERGDVIFITTKDGTLLRAMSVRDGKVRLAPVI